MFFSKKARDLPEVAPELPTPEGLRRRGPWDRNERDVTDTAGFLDFGSLLVRPVSGMQIQVASQSGVNLAVLISMNGSALELRAIAASRKGNDWEELLPLVGQEIRDRGAEPVEREGVFGTEVATEFPAKDPAGNDVVQPACFIGIRGPRWLLRATLIGEAAVRADADHELVKVIRDVVVVRGSEARILGEPLPLDVPDEMQEQKT